MLRTMRQPSDCEADVVPVDYVANSIITAVWYTGIHR